MPNGLALYHLDHSVGRQQRILQRIAPAPGGSGLAEAALSAVQDLAAAAGHPLSLTHPRAPAAEQRRFRVLPIVASVVAVLLIALAWGLSLWLAPPGSTPPARRTPPGGRAQTRSRMNERRRVGVGGASGEDAAEALAEHPVEEVQDDREREERPRVPVGRDRDADRGRDERASTRAIASPLPLRAAGDPVLQLRSASSSQRGPR